MRTVVADPTQMTAEALSGVYGADWKDMTIGSTTVQLAVDPAAVARQKPLGTMVVCEARHMCMMMRGVEKQNSITTTSDYSGVFNSLNTRQEFMSLLRGESKRI